MKIIQGNQSLLFIQCLSGMYFLPLYVLFHLLACLILWVHPSSPKHCNDILKLFIERDKYDALTLEIYSMIV